MADARTGPSWQRLSSGYQVSIYTSELRATAEDALCLVMITRYCANFPNFPLNDHRGENLHA